ALHPWEFFEWVEDLQTRTAKIPVVSGRDRESISSRRGSDVAVLNRHPTAGLFETMILVGPDVRDRDVEPMNAALHGIRQAGEPRLEGDALASVFASNPVGQLCDDHCARVAILLFPFQPRDEAVVAATFCGLADDVGVEKPAHSFRRRAGSRRLGGTS